MSSRASFSLTGICLAVLAVAGCASNPEEDPVQIKLKDLDTRLARIERVMANQSLLDLANQDEAMRGDLRAMHNDVDQLTNSLEASRKQQRDLYADLDRRMKAVESRGAAASSSAANPAAGSGDAGAAASGAAPEIAAIVTEETGGVFGWGMFNCDLAAGMLREAAAQAGRGELEPRPRTCAYRGGCMYPTICRCES